jgi:ATP-dependent RNA helicase DDX19/DBP5
VEDKTNLLRDMVLPNCENLGQTIIFVKTRKSAKDLSSELTRDGFTVTCIQGEMEHEDRDRVVREFRSGATKILIATDVLARGFDVSQVTLVVNYDIPVERNAPTPAYETYLHRIGRSGRFGRKGAAFNLTTGGLVRYPFPLPSCLFLPAKGFDLNFSAPYIRRIRILQECY